MQEPYESPVDRAIREAREQGAFDNLPGAGKPLPGLDGDDPDWWVRRYAEREHLDLSGALSPALALRKEKAGFPGSLVDLSTEESVRTVLEDYNRRVKRDRLRPAVGSRSPVLAGLVDVDDMVGRWRVVRTEAMEARQREMAERQAGTAVGAASGAGSPVTGAGSPAEASDGRGSWWRRMVRRRRPRTSA